jgi:hypothetical protein
MSVAHEAQYGGRRQAHVRHHEASRPLVATPDMLFAHLDDQTRLAAHPAKPSAMMGGGRVTYALDAGRGMTEGSRITMGAAFGLSLSVEEEATEREPAWRKAWRTVGTPRLLIIGAYAMGFRIEPAQGGSRLTVWIDYALPHSRFGHMLGRLFFDYYVR